MVPVGSDAVLFSDGSGLGQGSLEFDDLFLENCRVVKGIHVLLAPFLQSDNSGVPDSRFNSNLLSKVVGAESGQVETAVIQNVVSLGLHDVEDQRVEVQLMAGPDIQKGLIQLFFFRAIVSSAVLDGSDGAVEGAGESREVFVREIDGFCTRMTVGTLLRVGVLAAESLRPLSVTD